MNRAILLLGAMVSSCTVDAEPTKTREPFAVMATVPTSCASNVNCDYLSTHTYKDDMTHAKAMFLCAAWLYACQTQHPNPGPIDAGTGGNAPISIGGSSSVGGSSATGGGAALTPCIQACNNLKALGCPENQSTCVAMCNLHSTDDRFSQNITCRINAKTKAEAQKCGVASCR